MKNQDNKKIKEKNIILIDTPSFYQLDEIKIKKSAYIVIIDHHIHPKKENGEKEYSNPTNIAKIKIIKEDYTSTASIVYEIYTKIKEEITKQVAIFLLIGILGDTNFLKYANKKDIERIHKLMELTNTPTLKEFNFLFSDGLDKSSKGARVKALERINMRKMWR